MPYHQLEYQLQNQCKMDNYYQDLIKNIKKNINEGNYQTAKVMLDEEFKMPYIPQTIEEELINLQKNVDYYLQKPESQMSVEEILTNINKKGEVQFNAISNLIKLNLRDYIPEIQDFFNHNTNSLAYALLVDALIRQQIDFEFKITYLNQNYQYNFSKKVAGIESAGFKEAQNILKDYFENNDISVYQLSMQLLIQEFYLRAPFNPTIEQAKWIANAISKNVLEMLGLNLQDYSYIDFSLAQKIELLCLIVVF